MKVIDEILFKLPSTHLDLTLRYLIANTSYYYFNCSLPLISNTSELDSIYEFLLFQLSPALLIHIVNGHHKSNPRTTKIIAVRKSSGASRSDVQTPSRTTQHCAYSTSSVKRRESNWPSLRGQRAGAQPHWPFRPYWDFPLFVKTSRHNGGLVEGHTWTPQYHIVVMFNRFQKSHQLVPHFPDRGGPLGQPIERNSNVSFRENLTTFRNLW